MSEPGWFASKADATRYCGGAKFAMSAGPFDLSRNIESVLSMREVLAQARKSGVILYWLRLGDDRDVGRGYRVHTPWRDVDAHEREQHFLRQAIEESGGRVLTVGRVEGIRAALAEVLQELREQYVIGYYPSRLRGSGQWHDVRVEVAVPSVRVRTPRGYTEP